MERRNFTTRYKSYWPFKVGKKIPLDHSDLASFLPNEVVIQINIKTAVVAFFLLSFAK